MAIIQNSVQAQQSVSLITREAGREPFPSPASSASLQILIANPRLESKLSSNHPSQLQISNRERMAFFRSGPSRAINHFERPASELEPPTSNRYTAIRISRNSNKNKTPIQPLIVTKRRFSLLFLAQHSSLVSCRPALAPVAPTSRKAIMSRNHFTQIPRSKPLMRKVTNADTNQS